MLTADLFSNCCALGCLLNNDGQLMCAVVLGLDCKVCQVLDPAAEVADALMLCSYVSLQKAMIMCVRVNFVILYHGL